MNMLTAPGITMSSDEIADICSARHNDVVATIERLFEKGVLRESRKTTRRVQPAGGGRPMDVYDLTKRDSLVVVSGYDDEVRAKLIDRWIELESGRATASLPDFGDPVAAARAWADEREARQIAERTKAQIGSRREATAMNAASQAVKKLKKLEIELDRSLSCATVKRMEDHYGRAFPWRPLKKAAEAMGAPSENVADANYGTVKAYRAEVWREVYGVEIPPPE